MSSPVRADPFVDGIAVLLHLVRNGLPALRSGLTEVKVFEDVPDELSKYIPCVRIARTGGASTRPRFHSGFLTNIQVWSNAETGPGWDPDEAARMLSRQVATVLIEAQENQTVTPFGWIAHWRESSGFRKLPDPGQPYAGRYMATYDLLIRNPRP